jgi:hypothetical protein
VRASTNSINTLRGIELYSIIELVVTIKGTVPGTSWREPSRKTTPPCAEGFFRIQPLPDKIHEESVWVSSRPGDAPHRRFHHIYRGLNQFFLLFMDGKLSVVTDFGCHRNADEHDHKFGILPPLTAASNEWRRNGTMLAGLQMMESWQYHQQFDSWKFCRLLTQGSGIVLEIRSSYSQSNPNPL